MNEKVFIKKMIKEVNGGDYAKAKETLKTVVEAKIQRRIKDAMEQK
jgi:hypothetical protein